MKLAGVKVGRVTDIDVDRDAGAVTVEWVVDEGIEIYELPEDELARWHEVGQSVTDSWIAAREAEGVPAQQMYDDMQEIKAGY